MLQRTSCAEAEAVAESSIRYRSRDNHRKDSEDTSAAVVDRRRDRLNSLGATKPDSSPQFVLGRFAMSSWIVKHSEQRV